LLSHFVTKNCLTLVSIDTMMWEKYQLILGAVAGFMPRPSNKELFNKIKAGKEIVANGNIYLINQEAIAEDAIELGYQIIKLQSILIVLLEEVQLDNYIGGRPP